MLSVAEGIKKKRGEGREGEPLRETTGWVSTDETRQDNNLLYKGSTNYHEAYQGCHEKRELMMRFSLINIYATARPDNSKLFSPVSPTLL